MEKLNRQNCLKGLFRIQNEIVYLHSLFKISLFRAYAKETVVFTFLVLWLILVNIFGPRKDKACCSVFVFLRRISKSICDLALYLLHEGLNISLIYDATILLQYLKRVLAMQDSTLSEAIRFFKISRTYVKRRG